MSDEQKNAEAEVDQGTRVHAEAPAEGGTQGEKATDERAHSEAPAEG